MCADACDNLSVEHGAQRLPIATGSAYCTVRLRVVVVVIAELAASVAVSVNA